MSAQLDRYTKTDTPVKVVYF